MSRADRVADLLAERSLDLLLVTNLVNVRYLTGYTGSNGIAVVGRDVRLGADVSIGPFAVIGDGTRIGTRSIVLAHAVIGRDVARSMFSAVWSA